MWSGTVRRGLTTPHSTAARTGRGDGDALLLLLLQAYLRHESGRGCAGVGLLLAEESPAAEASARVYPAAVRKSLLAAAGLMRLTCCSLGSPHGAPFVLKVEIKDCTVPRHLPVCRMARTLRDGDQAAAIEPGQRSAISTQMAYTHPFTRPRRTPLFRVRVHPVQLLVRLFCYQQGQTRDRGEG